MATASRSRSPPKHGRRRALRRARRRFGQGRPCPRGPAGPWSAISAAAPTARPGCARTRRPRIAGRSNSPATRPTRPPCGARSRSAACCPTRWDSATTCPACSTGTSPSRPTSSPPPGGRSATWKTGRRRRAAWTGSIPACGSSWSRTSPTRWLPPTPRACSTPASSRPTSWCAPNPTGGPASCWPISAGAAPRPTRPKRRAGPTATRPAARRGSTRRRSSSPAARPPRRPTSMRWACCCSR